MTTIPNTIPGKFKITNEGLNTIGDHQIQVSKRLEYCSPSKIPNNLNPKNAERTADQKRDTVKVFNAIRDLNDSFQSNILKLAPKSLTDRVNPFGEYQKLVKDGDSLTKLIVKVQEVVNSYVLAENLSTPVFKETDPKRKGIVQQEVTATLIEETPKVLIDAGSLVDKVLAGDLTEAEMNDALSLKPKVTNSSNQKINVVEALGDYEAKETQNALRFVVPAKRLPLKKADTSVVTGSIVRCQGPQGRKPPTNRRRPLQADDSTTVSQPTEHTNLVEVFQKKRLAEIKAEKAAAEKAALIKTLSSSSRSMTPSITVPSGEQSTVVKQMNANAARAVNQVKTAAQEAATAGVQQAQGLKDLATVRSQQIASSTSTQAQGAFSSFKTAFSSYIS